MAEHIHKSYTCDRCKADLGSELPRHSQRADVSASFNWSTGPGPTFKWTDMCDECRAEVFAFFQPNEWDRKKS